MAKKRGWCFWRRGEVDTPMHTMKLDALLHKTRIKVLRLDICTSMILSKIAHQMWRDHPFSQRNKATEWAVGVGVGDKREVMGGGGGCLYKIGGGLGPLCQLWYGIFIYTYTVTNTLLHKILLQMYIYICIYIYYIWYIYNIYIYTV